MAIQGKENINVGFPNQPQGSDSLYTAFNKVKTNFDTIFACASPYSVVTGNTGIFVNPNSTAGTLDIFNIGVTGLSVSGNGIAITGTSNGGVYTGNLVLSLVGAGTGSVTSVEVTSTTLSITGTNPITTSGTINIELPSSFSVTGNIEAGNILTDNLLYANGEPYSFSGNGTPDGANTQVQYNNAGAFGASANFTFNQTTNTLSVTNITAISNLNAGQGSFTGNVQLADGSGGSITGANLISANFLLGTINTANQPNITNIGTLSSLSVSGNANIGNLGVGNSITSTGNVSAGNVIVGAGSGGSLIGANLISANYFIGDGGLLSNISGNASNVQQIVNGTSSLKISSLNGNITANVNGTSDVAIFTPTGFNVTGNVSAGNVIVGAGSGGSLIGANLISANYFIGDGGLLSNISVNALSVQQIVNGTSEFKIVSPNGNITANINGTSNVAVFTQNGLDITGNLSVSGTLNATVETANIANNVVGTVKVPFTYSNVSPLNLVQVSSGSIITEVSLVIVEAFNGTNPSLSVGDGSNANRLLATTDCLANEIGTYTVSPAYKYASTTQLILTITSGSSTAGEGLIIINYK